MPLLRGALYALNYGFLPGRAPTQRFLRGHFAAMTCFERRAYTSRLRVMLDFDRTRALRPAICATGRGGCCWPRPRTMVSVPPAERAALHALYPQAQRRSFAQGRHADTVQARPKKLR